jgi:acetolactate synthase-1/3 small subunit
MMRRRTILVLLQDHPGSLTRAVSVFRRRGINIVSLHVQPTARTGMSELTCVVDAESADDINRSLGKLVEVIEVHEVHHSQADGEA